MVSVQNPLCNSPIKNKTSFVIFGMIFMNIILVDQINEKDNPIGRFFELLVFGKL
jgi:hypothetical protein